DTSERKKASAAELFTRNHQLNSYRLLDRKAKLSNASCLRKPIVRLLLERLKVPGYSLIITQINLAVSKPLCFLRLAWQLGTKNITAERLSSYQIFRFLNVKWRGQDLLLPPPHDSFGAIIEIPQFILIKEITYKVAENSLAALLQTHQVSAVLDFPLTLCFT
ncbi:hypothetical protein CSKR_108914, partial [Clonorchis sinensis]